MAKTSGGRWGLPSRTPTATAERLARFFSRTEFAVVSRSRIRDCASKQPMPTFRSGLDHWYAGRSCRC